MGLPMATRQYGTGALALVAVFALVGFLAIASFEVTGEADGVENTLAEAPVNVGNIVVPSAKDKAKAKAVKKAKKAKKQAAGMVSPVGAAAILAKAKAKAASEKLKAHALKSDTKAKIKKAAKKLAKQQQAAQKAQQKALRKAKKVAQRGLQKARKTMKKLAKHVQHKVNKLLAKQRLRETDAAIASKKVAAARALAGQQAAHNMHVAARATAKAAQIHAAVAKALKVASTSKDPAVQTEVKVLKQNLHKSLSKLHKALLVAQHASSLASKAAGGKSVPKPLSKKKVKKKSVELLAAGATLEDQ